jgi:hypothetical protein
MRSPGAAALSIRLRLFRSLARIRPFPASRCVVCLGVALVVVATVEQCHRCVVVVFGGYSFPALSDLDIDRAVETNALAQAGCCVKGEWVLVECAAVVHFDVILLATRPNGEPHPAACISWSERGHPQTALGQGFTARSSIPVETGPVPRHRRSMSWHGPKHAKCQHKRPDSYSVKARNPHHDSTHFCISVNKQRVNMGVSFAVRANAGNRRIDAPMRMPPGRFERPTCGLEVRAQLIPVMIFAAQDASPSPANQQFLKVTAGWFRATRSVVYFAN